MDYANTVYALIKRHVNVLLNKLLTKQQDC